MCHKTRVHPTIFKKTLKFTWPPIFMQTHSSGDSVIWVYRLHPVLSYSLSIPSPSCWSLSLSSWKRHKMRDIDSVWSTMYWQWSWPNKLVQAWRTENATGMDFLRSSRPDEGFFFFSVLTLSQRCSLALADQCFATSVCTAHIKTVLHIISH